MRRAAGIGAAVDRLHDEPEGAGEQTDEDPVDGADGGGLSPGAGGLERDRLCRRAVRDTAIDVAGEPDQPEEREREQEDDADDQARTVVAAEVPADA